MIDRPTAPTRPPRHDIRLLLVAGLVAACSGKRFSAQTADTDAAVDPDSNSELTTTATASLPMTFIDVVSTPVNVRDDAGSTPDFHDAAPATVPVSAVMDAGSEQPHTSAPNDASRVSAPLESDETMVVVDASLTETWPPESNASIEAGTSAESSAAPPLHPCNEGEFETPREVRGLGFNNNLWGPGISGDGQHLYFGHTEGDEDLFVAKLDGTDPTNFDRAQPLTTLNTGTSEGTPFVTSNGLNIYFYATREGGPGDRDLWHASRENLDAEFDNPALVEGANDDTYDHLPWLSSDELTLYYTTLRDDGLGQSDIWMATRATKADPFSEHQLVPGINSPAREDAVAFSPNGLTVLFSTDRDTDGDLDIWHATRASLSEDFTDAHVIAGLNSDAEDTNLSLTDDGRHLYFSSGRSGEQRIWVASRSCALPE